MPDRALPAITCKELRRLEDKTRKHLIIDVRDPADYEAGHIEGSVHIPFAELEANVPSLAHDRKELVVVVGERPEQAEETGAHLAKAGYRNVKFLTGGFDEWCKPADPDISDVLAEEKEDEELAEATRHHGEDVDDVEQGSDDEPLM